MHRIMSPTRDDRRIKTDRYLVRPYTGTPVYRYMLTRPVSHLRKLFSQVTFRCVISLIENEETLRDCQLYADAKA